MSETEIRLLKEISELLEVVRKQGEFIQKIKKDIRVFLGQDESLGIR